MGAYRLICRGHVGKLGYYSHIKTVHGVRGLGGVSDHQANPLFASAPGCLVEWYKVRPLKGIDID